jgi:hydroxyacylglutathione hydrolase
MGGRVMGGRVMGGSVIGSKGMEIVTIATPEIGDRSYLVTDGRHALVVDPQRDIDRVVAAAAGRGVAITQVVETHIHNDYLSGGLALARLTGARYGVSREEAVAFPRDPLSDGDSFSVGDLVVQVVATPGHTPHHLSYVVTHHDGLGTDAIAVFSGGSLLFGAAGRTDLAGTGLTDRLARAQWASIRRLAGRLPVDATVHPTHGFGSFCAAGGTGGTGDWDSSTIRH